MSERYSSTVQGPGMGRILVVDDDEDVLVTARLLLKRHYPFIRTESDPARLPDLLEDAGEGVPPYDVIILDMNFAPGANSGREGLEWLERIIRADPAAVVVMITAYGEVDLAVEAMKRGAADFVVKPWQNEQLLATVRRALALRDEKLSRVAVPRSNPPSRSASGELLPRTGVPHDTAMIGGSRAMQKVWDIIQRAAPSDANVLILGENGTGKELVAREVHRFSRRAARIFLPVDLGEIPESLFEAEMFGHRKGAFTGARDDRVGRFQAAEGGTLFLDEIGNLPLHLQGKLLSALERREVRPVGASTPVPVDVRLIVATNLGPEDLKREDSFRRDLLYRVNTVEITLPPLRERIEDISDLVAHFQSLFARKYNLPERRLSQAARERLMAHTWPGNVRELRHAVERATIMSRGDMLSPADFPLDDASGARTAEGPGEIAMETFNLDTVERTVIERALKKNAVNVSRSARELGITRASLYRRMEKYGL